MATLVYRKLDEALKDGFQVYDRIADGYLVRRRNPTSNLWEMAIVDLTGIRF